MEERLRFRSGDLKLEGLLDLGSGDKGVVITHPHPQYGGDMENMVVELIAMVYRKSGFSTLRFNFRGVGDSDGTHSEGRKEPEDVCAAATFLSKKGPSEIHLAGYSFGAWVNSMVKEEGFSFAKSAMVSPPVAFMGFPKENAAIDSLALVVSGSQDELAPPSEIEKYMPLWNPSAVLEVVEGADHFYWDHFRTLDEILSSHVS